MKPLSLTFAAVCGAMVVGKPQVGSSQDLDCAQLKSFTQVQGIDPVFASAYELSQDLRRSGFVVKCILRSHHDGIFEGQKGAAMYRTDRGDFDALFLALPQTFDNLRIVERREGQAYVYSFEGSPKPWPANRMESSKPIYFIKHGQRLLVVRGDEKLAARLRRPLTARER